MKKVILFLCLFLFASLQIEAKSKKWYQQQDPRIEIVNETTVIFKDVIKVEVKTSDKNQITYVYDLKHSKLVRVSQGSFDVEVSLGDYLIQSNKKITKTNYEIIIE